jgi:hypothetical protein
MKVLSDIESYFEHELPKVYKAFLVQHTQEMESDIYLYMAEDLIERNETYETKQYAPGFINIGDNGGGEAFLLSLSDPDAEVSIVDHGSMDPELRRLVHKSFGEWRASGFQYTE